MATQYASQSVTITVTTLASGAARESTAITTDTAVNVEDYRVFVKPTVGAGTPAGSKATFVYAYASDDGTNYTGNATGTNAAITLDTPNQFALLGVINMGTASTSRGGSFSLRAAFGGSIPLKWGIIIENQIGIAFTACTVAIEKEYTS